MPRLYRNMAKSRIEWLSLLCVVVYDLCLQLTDPLGVEEIASSAPDRRALRSEREGDASGRALPFSRSFRYTWMQRLPLHHSHVTRRFDDW